MVEKFVHDPMQFYGHPKNSLAQVKNPFGDYAPASGAIQGMLKGMYDAMTSDLESKNADQAIKQKQFEELTATKNSELPETKKIRSINESNIKTNKTSKQDMWENRTWLMPLWHPPMVLSLGMHGALYNCWHFVATKFSTCACTAKRFV